MDTQKFSETFPDLKPLLGKASRGDVDARFLLARYDDAVGRHREAFEKYLTGAKAGHASSMFFSAMHLYTEGQLDRDDPQDLKLFIRAASLGEAASSVEFERCGLGRFEPYAATGAEAAYMAGLMFEKGIGMRADSHEAFEYYQQAVNEVGHLGAMVALGSLYRRGIGTKRDLDKAVELLIRASQLGSPEAFYELGILHDKFGGVANDPATAAEHYWEAARRGHADAAHNLADLFARGAGIEQDLVGALLWYAWADRRGDRRAAPKVSKVKVQLRQAEIARARELYAKARENFTNCGLFEAEL